MSAASKREVFSFAADLQRFAARLTGRLDELTRNVGFEFARNIIVGGKYAPGTPVDTGFARNSWVVGINGEGNFRQAGTRWPPGTKVSAEERKSKVPVLSLGETGPALLNAKCGDVLWLTSNCVYMGGAKGLEYGHSGQAPAGMVRLTVAAGGQIVHDVVQEMAS